MDSDSSLLYESCTPSASDVNLGEEVTSRLAPLENCFEEFEESPYRIESQADDFDQNPGGPLSIETHASDPIHEDFEVMGIENTWTDEDAFAGPPPPVEAYSEAIPLPPPPIRQRDGVLTPQVQFDETDFPRGCTDIDPHQELESLFSSPTNTPNEIGLDDLKDTSACPGVCGIQNLGNTCFMSAGLQCLGATPSLVQCFTNQKYLSPLCSSLSTQITGKLSSSTQVISPTSTLSTEYASLLTKMWSGRYSVVNPSEFKKSLGETHPQFKDFRQHDCQEFLALLLDTLHEELNTATNKKASAFSGNFSASSPPLTSLSSNQCSSSSLSFPSNNLPNGTIDAKVPGWSKPLVWSGLSKNHKDAEINVNGKSWSPFSEEYKSSCGLEKMELSIERTAVDEEEGEKDEAGKSEDSKCTSIEVTDSEELPDEQPFITQNFIRNETNASCGEEAGCSWNVSSPCSTSVRKIEKNEVQAQQMSMESKKISDGIGQLRRSLPFPGALPIPSRGTVGLEDIMKEAKTSNVNVLASETSINGGIKYDSDKFVRRIRRGGEGGGVVTGIISPENDLSHNLAVIQDCDVQDGVSGEVLAGKTKRLKDTNLVFRGVGGMSELQETKQDIDSEVIINPIPKPPNEFFNNVKRMRLASVKTQSYAKANGILGKNIGLIGSASCVLGNNTEVMHVDERDEDCDAISESTTQKNKSSLTKCNSDLEKSDKVPSPTECVVDKISSLNGLGDVSRTAKESQRRVVNEIDQSEAEDDFVESSMEEEENEADRHWQKHITANRSTIVDTFQGQFKSTVVCSACKHVSVTYEPFMYLSVPLPHAMERQICVTFVPAEAKPPVRYLLTLSKQGKVSEMRQQLYKILAEENKLKSPNSESTFPQDPNLKPDIALAEVLDNHIAKILDDNYLLRYVNSTTRSIYAFELKPPPLAYGVSPPGSISSTSKDGRNSNSIRPTGEPLDLTNAKLDCLQGVCKAMEGIDDKKKDNSNGPFGSDGWRSCAICLEEMDTDLRVHSACSCVLCESCIETSCRHYGGDSLACPVCGQVVDPKEEFIPLDKVGDSQPPAVRILQVPVVFRVDEEGDGNNNRKTMKLWGHPALLRLPSRIQARDLYEAVERLLPPCLLSFNSTPNSASPSTSSFPLEEEIGTSKYQLLLVDGQGYHCSRCMYTVHCRGCHITSQPHAETALQAGDTLAVRIFAKDLSVDACGDGMLPLFEREVMDHRSMRDRWKEEPLSLYDCLQAFSESEMLDEHNPWFCPVCQLNQCATKTLSVWRYPDFLIVYLKRFVFHECVSTKLDDKVTFPLCGLHVAPPQSQQSFSQSSNHCNQIQRHHRGSPHPYNLYAAVCHFGGASAGHYTAYSKHPGTSEWHYFNDEAVSRQKPREEDYSNAYILFYHKQGLSFDLLSMPKKISASVDEEEDEEEEESAKDLKPNIEQLILDLDSSVEQDWKEQKIVGQTAMVVPVAGEAMEGSPF